MRMRWGAVALAGVLPYAVAAQPVPAAAPAPAEAPVEMEVVVTAPLAGSEIERGKVPVNTGILRQEDLQRTGPASTLRALDERIGNVTLNQAQGNEFQPNLLYRGFEASPLVGNAQGLAVYLNGTRFNQPFGDTVNWDLIPDIAVDRIEVAGPNPAFGLNALGGAITVKLKDGFTYHGAQLEMSGGSFGRIQGSAQYGVQSGNTAAYIAGTALNDDGWRDHSPSQLRQIYGDVGYRGDKAEVHVNLVGAINNLTGNGTTPVDLLAASRSAVFTYPDSTANKYLRLTTTGSYEVSDRISLQATAYYSNLAQRTRNGNASDAQPCPDDQTLLCNGDGTPYTTRGGGRIANTLNPGLYPGVTGGGPYSQLDETATDSNGFGVALQGTHRSEVFGRTNRLLVGASYDGGRTTFSARSSLGALTLDRNYVGPGAVISQDDGSVTPVRLDASNDYYGVYASDTLDVTDRLSLTVSGRLNVAEIDLQDRIGTALTGNHSFTKFNPAAGATYKLLPNVSLYGGYSQSNRAPTPAELSCASPASPCSLTNFFVSDPSLKQVVAQNYEAGVRGSFGLASIGGPAAGRVSWNLGLFRTDADDDILFTTSVALGRGYFQNVGSTRRQGVEAGVSLRQGGLLAYLDYAYTEATFQSGFTVGSQNNPFADANGNTQVRPGNVIPGVPTQQLKFGVQYQVTPEWTVGTTGIASGGRYLQGDAANLTPKTAPYVVLNLNTAYQVTQNIQVFGLVQNVTDAKYATYGGFSPTSLVPIVQAPGATNTRSLVPGAPVAGFGGVRVTF
ncbi:MAG: TonB-dependent receptor [Janthinobacterium lividum]